MNRIFRFREPERAVPDNSRKGKFESMTRKHVDSLWTTALRMSGSRETADDLVQETCLRAYRAFDEYQPGTNYKAWIFRILTNLYKDCIRRESRSPLVFDDESVLREAASNSIRAPDRELLASEFNVAVKMAMRRLRPDVRVVISLSLLGDFSYEQIAELMDIPVGTVRSRISRGRLQLQRDLLDYVEDEDLNKCKKENSLSKKNKQAKKTESTDMGNVLEFSKKTANLKCTL